MSRYLMRLTKYEGNMENQLVVIQKDSALTVFTETDKLTEILKNIENQVLPVAFDVQTAKGRKEIASAAYRVAQSKSYLDSVGKDLVDEYKEVPKKIDANRKTARDFLDKLKEAVRQPLTQWEAAQERIEAERKEAEEAEKLRIEIEHLHEVGLLINAEFDRKRAEAEAETKRQQEDRERQIAEAAAKAAREAAEKEALERQQKTERDAKEAAERAQRQKIEAELAAEKAEREKIEAQQRHEREMKEAEERAQRQAQAAAEAERQRIENERLAKEAEDRKREADVKHKKAVNNAALKALVESAGITEDQGKAVIKAILAGLIPAVTIKY